MKSPTELRRTAEAARNRALQNERAARALSEKERHARAVAALPALRADLEKAMEQAAARGEDHVAFSVSDYGERDYEARSAAMYLLAQDVRAAGGFSVGHPHEDVDRGVGSDPGPTITSTTLNISWKKAR